MGYDYINRSSVCVTNLHATDAGASLAETSWGCATSSTIAGVVFASADATNSPCSSCAAGYWTAETSAPYLCTDCNAGSVSNCTVCTDATTCTACQASTDLAAN
jgi:hypothetical protein